jgi:hypothetical protein
MNAKNLMTMAIVVLALTSISMVGCASNRVNLVDSGKILIERVDSENIYASPRCQVLKIDFIIIQPLPLKVKSQDLTPEGFPSGRRSTGCHDFPSWWK